MPSTPYRVSAYGPGLDGAGTGLPGDTPDPVVRRISDGAPHQDAAPLPGDTPSGLLGRAHRAATRIREFEGPRGYSTRATVAMRHVGYFASLVLCFGAAHWAFSANPTWRFGGLVMLYSVMFMFVCAVVGTVLYAEARVQIYDQARHFVFGIVAVPGAALALFMRIVSSALDGPAADQDMFASLIRGNGLPLIYFSLVVIPAFVFAKYIFGGIRSINRQAMADEEQVAAYMRQDGWQR